MRYEEPRPITRNEADSVFATNDPLKVCDALVRITFFDRDWRWVQERCLRLARQSDPDIRGCAATCLGHLARIHRVLDVEKVIPVLEELLMDPELAGRAEDALNDLKMFLSKK